ncbi:hypothetical protein BP50_001481 [Kingella potus DSM 18304]
MQTTVTFRSNAFAPVENDTVNAPQCYGKKLAQWLAAELPAHGLAVTDCYAEDWGWEIAFANADFPLYLGCGNMDDGGEPAFRCFITPDRPAVRPLKRLFRAVDTRPAVGRLAAALDSVLRAHPHISGIEWENG